MLVWQASLRLPERFQSLTAAANGAAPVPDPVPSELTAKVVFNLFKQLKKPLFLITFAILLFFALTNFSQLLNGMVWLFGLFGPFWIGVLLAMILNRPYNFFRFTAFKKLGKPNGKHTAGLRKILALLTVYLLFTAVLILLIFMIFPQLVESIQKLSNNFSSYTKGLESILNRWLDNFGIRSQVWESIDKMWNDFISGLGKMLTNDVVPYLVSTIGGIATGVSNFFVGVVSSVYILAGKEKLIVQFKRLIRAILPVKSHSFLNRVWHLSNSIFSEFIIGQLANAAVVGVLCFIGMSILRMDYALLISALVSVANVIPFFGCVIGAVPSAFILLMVDPMQALWFVVFITLVQAVDGNIISPRIVGESIGLSGLWVMVAIIVGGSVFGIAGMFLGVPLFAVLYALTRDFTIARERKHAEQLAADPPASEGIPSSETVHSPVSEETHK